MGDQTSNNPRSGKIHKNEVLKVKGFSSPQLGMSNAMIHA